MGVSLVASSDVRGLGGAKGVVLATPEATWEVASSDVRRAMGVPSDDWEGQWVCLQRCGK